MKKKDEEVKKFLKEWIKHEEVRSHIKSEIEKELHKVLLTWARTGKITIDKKCKHRTLAGFVNSDKANVCIDCGKTVAKKAVKS